MLYSLLIIHETKHYISNITSDLFVWDGQNMDTLTFSSSLTQSMKLAQFKDKTSIIVGTTCISPYQIIWDMLHSKSEESMIEYSDFKKKIKIFWEGILKPEYKFVPRICQTLYGKKTGLDYIDMIIKRWCQIDQSKSGTFIEKNTNKVNSTSYLYMIDYFVLGFQVMRYIELLKSKNILKDNMDDLEEFMYDCITMNIKSK